MARKRIHPPLNVYLNGKLVGLLRRKKSGAIDFRYDPAWLDWENSFAISISLPLREDRYVGDPVVAVFDNLLPDNNDIRQRLATRKDAGGTDAYSLLSSIGRDCVGALQFLPEDIAPDQAGLVKGTPVTTDEIAAILSDLERAPLGLSKDSEFRISLAGVQEKTALLYWKGKWHKPLGSTATTHILKPQIGIQSGTDLSQSVENEFFCMQILRALGLPTAEVSIADFANQRALVVERFDRQWTKDGRLLRLPQEDCCQALSVQPSLKYESDGGPGIVDILELLKASDDPESDQRLFMKAQIAFWLLGATDGHAKNFSIFLYPGGGFLLTPLYDVMSTQPLFDNKQLTKNQIRMAMAAAGNNRHYKVYEILPRHYMQTADKAGFPPNQVVKILAELKDQMHAAVKKAENQLSNDFPDELRKSITNGIDQRVNKINETGRHPLFS